jgi:hypothetical protein
LADPVIIPQTKHLVRFDRAQSLTDPQKAQVKANIGFSWGDLPGFLPLDKLPAHSHTNLVPYTGSTGPVDLGVHRLTAGSASLGGNFGIGTNGMVLEPNVGGAGRMAIRRASGQYDFYIGEGGAGGTAVRALWLSTNPGPGTGDVGFVRNATGPTAETRAAGGLKVCNADGSAVGPMQCGTLNATGNSLIGGQLGVGPGGANSFYFDSQFNLIVWQGGAVGWNAVGGGVANGATTGVRLSYASPNTLQVGTNANNALGTLRLARTDLGALPVGPTYGPLNIAVDGAGNGITIAGSAGDFIRYVSGGFVKGLLGSGSVPLVVSSPTVALRSDDTIRFRNTADTAFAGLQAGLIEAGQIVVGSGTHALLSAHAGSTSHDSFADFSAVGAHATNRWAVGIDHSLNRFAIAKNPGGSGIPFGSADLLTLDGSGNLTASGNLKTNSFAAWGTTPPAVKPTLPTNPTNAEIASLLSTYGLCTLV